MMDTTNSLANSGVSKCKPRMHFKLGGTSKAMKSVISPKKSIRTAPESDGSSSSESSSCEGDNGMKVIPKSSNHSLRNSHHSHRSSTSHSSKRSNLKKASARAPPPDADISDSEEYGDLMKDYCYNENNVLVPRIRLDTAATPTIEVDGDDDDASVGSSRSARRLRRGGRRPNSNGDDGGFEVVESSPSSAGHKKAVRRRGEFSFWDQDNDSSDEEEIFKISPPKSQSASKEKSSPAPHRFSMTAAPRKTPTATSRDNASTDSMGYFTAQVAPPERRTPGRADSGWHTGGSFDSSDEDEPAEKSQAPRISLSKLSQAAQRMSRPDNANPSFTFAKKNAKMDGYTAKSGPAIADPIGLGDDDDAEDRTGDHDDSNNSEASKTTASFVSAGGWSTGKDSSSSEDEKPKKSAKKVASKKESTKKSKKESKSIKSKKVEASINDADPFAEFDNPKGKGSSFNISGHSTDSKFSFVSANSASLESGSTFSEEDAVSPITCSVASSRRLSMTDLKDMPEELKLEALTVQEEHGQSFVFDMSAMEFDTEGIFEDQPPTPKNEKDTTQARSGKVTSKSDEEPKSAEEPKVEKTPKRASKKPKREKESSKKPGYKKDKEKSALGGDLKKEKREKLKPSSKEKDKTKHHSGKSKKEKDKLKEHSDSKKKKSSEAKVVETKESKKEEKKKDVQKLPTTAEDKHLEKRRQERAARLEKAKERIRQQQHDKEEEDEIQRKVKMELELSPRKTASTEYDRRERAYQWYTRCGMITKEKLKIRIKTIPHCDITNEDIDLLPWMTGDRIVNVAKMMQYAREK
eukprot:scaffold7349_cov173-Amphora_coffeaeformis.AAC.143